MAARPLIFTAGRFAATHGVWFISTLVVAALVAAFVLMPHAKQYDAPALASEYTAQSTQPDGVPADQRFPVGSADMNRARSVAASVWGAEPCSGQVQITWAPLAAHMNASAAWKNTQDGWTNPQGNFDCRIEFNQHGDYDFVKLCTVMAHELGHLHGRQHETNEASLMAPAYSGPIQQCVDADPTPPVAADSPVTYVDDEDDADGIEDGQFDEPRRTLSRKPLKQCSTAKSAKAARAAKAAKRTPKCAAASKRCITVKKAGKRIKRCTTARAATRTAAKASQSKRSNAEFGVEQ